MRWLLLLLLLSGCSTAPTTLPPQEPIWGATMEGPWGNATSRLIADDTVLWHGEATDPGALRSRTWQFWGVCTSRGEPDRSSQWLGSSSMWNFTERVEVTLTWDPLSYTQDQLMVSFRPHPDAGARESEPAVSGHAIVIPVDPYWWTDPDTADWQFQACVPWWFYDDPPPPQFEGELHYRIVAHRQPRLVVGAA